MNRIIALIVLCMLPALSLSAQPPAQPKQKPSPEEMQKAMEASMAMFVPVLVKMTEGIVDAKLEIAGKPETAERIATFKRNLYDALIRQGFTKDEALRMTINTGFPSAMPEMP